MPSFALWDNIHRFQGSGRGHLFEGVHHSAHYTLSQQTYIYGHSSQSGMIGAPGDIQKCLETFLLPQLRGKDSASILLIEASDIAKYPTRHSVCESAQLCPNTWTVVRQALLSMRFSRQDTGVGYHALLQEIFPIQGSNPCLLRLLHWQADSLTPAPPEKPHGSSGKEFTGNAGDTMHRTTLKQRINQPKVSIVLRLRNPDL